MKRLYGVRGAVCAENTNESISLQTTLMCRELFKRNNICASDIVSIQFSLTKDLDALNPCAALRHSDVGIDTSKIPLFCTQEAYIRGGLEKVIRILITVYLEDNAKTVPIYMGGAECLRPDFCKK